MTASSPRPTAAARVFRSFTIVLVVLFVAYVVRASAGRSNDVRAAFLVGGILAGSSWILALLTRLAWTRIRAPLPRFVVAALLAYHALFGPAMMLSRIADEVSSNDDLVVRLWPHVVHAIDSLE